MALPTYTYGSIPTDSEFNAFLRPTFVIDEAGEEFPGQLFRLRDDSLSNDATQIKGRWTAFENELKVTAGSGLNFSYTGGVVILENGNVATISPGALVATNNATNWVFVDTSGVVAVSTTEPTSKMILATVVTSAGAISAVVDRRSRGFRVQPNWNLVTRLGGSGADGDYTLSGSATLSRGYYDFRNFDIQSTATLTIDKGARIRVSGSCTIAGTITVTGATSGGGVAGSNHIVNGPFDGAGLGGGTIGIRTAYSPFISPVGSGGGSAYAVVVSGSWSSFSTNEGGLGGGSLILEAAQAITIASTATIQARGGNGGAIASPSGTGVIQCPGAGGGSGGLIQLTSAVSITAAAGSTLDVRGGTGGPAFQSGGGNAYGGGGGGGGYIFASAPTVSIVGTTNLTGGAQGANAGSPTGGGVSGGSFGGTGGRGTNVGYVAATSGQLITRTGVYV